MRTFRDLQGREAGLGRCLGQGGEGAVYSVPMWPRSVAKIYARRPDDHTRRKLQAMVELGLSDERAAAPVRATTGAAARSRLHLGPGRAQHRTHGVHQRVPVAEVENCLTEQRADLVVPTVLMF